MAPGRTFWVLALAAAVASGAHAHDSWLSPAQEPSSAGGVALELSTGTRFPAQEFPQTAESVAQARCVDGRGGGAALAPVAQQPRRLDMHTDGRPLACGLELREAQIRLDPAIVKVYFRDIHPAPAVVNGWAEQLAEGQPWLERYRKFMRIELAAAARATPAERALARKPMGLPLEIVVEGDAPLAAGPPAVFRVLRDGKPLANFPVELVSERNPLGIWRVTDAEGLLRHVLPFSGRWLLRGTDVRRSAQDAAWWESRFVTLAFEVP